MPLKNTKPHEKAAPRKNHIYLPPEIVEMIVGYLTFDHPPTLMNLAKTCRTYYACCRPAIKSLIFHDIKLPVPLSRYDGDEFKVAAKNVVNRLEAAQSFNCVRRLFISCKRIARWSWRGPIAEAEAEPRDWKPPRLADLKCASRADTYTTQYGRWEEESHAGHSRLFGWKSKTSDVENFHQPVVELIKILPRLTDLIWSWSAEIPPSVLENLHQYRPGCRLHVDYFFVPCAYLHEEQWKSIKLLQSDSLHTITLACPTGEGCYTFLLRNAGLAPNLKVLRFKAHRHDGPMLRSSLVQKKTTPDRRASIEELHFEESGNFKSQLLCDWSDCTDFSALQVLHIAGILEDDAFNIWNKAGMSFPFLRSLSLNLGPDVARSAEFYESARTFITDLPWLCELELNGWHTIVSVESLVACHGSRLRKLELTDPPPWQFLNEQEIHVLGDRCPLLQELAIPVLRTQGDVEELKVYKALGSLKNLQHLDLTYQVTPVTFHQFPRESIYSGSTNNLSILNTPPKNVLWDDFENEFIYLDGSRFSLSNGHVRSVIIDSVIDEKLISAVFKVISENKPPKWPPLKGLRLTCTGVTYGATIEWTVRNFTSRWHAMRNPYSRARKRVLVEQVHSDGTGTSKYDDLPEAILPVFYRLFPAAAPKGPPRKQSKKLAIKREREKRENTPMWKHWLHSFPLHLPTTDRSASSSRS